MIGLGRTFVGLSDDVNSMFLNPAGLASLGQWEMTSMSGKFAEEYSYLLINGAYPTERFGTFGVGYVRASTGGVPVTKVLEGTEADPIYVIDPSQPAIDYYNSVMFLSWGKELPRLDIPKLTFLKDIPISIGASYKMFGTSLTGDHIIDGAGTGTELDLGLRAEVNPWITLGAYGRNVLPYSMGGKLTYGDSYSETYPATFYYGANVNLFGGNGPIKNDKLEGQKLNLLTDFEYNQSRPLLMHAGAEWEINPMIAVRIGLDQDVTSDKNSNKVIESSLAYGVGFNYAGFRFDYAMHNFPGLPGVSNQYFSFTYGLPWTKSTQPVKRTGLASGEAVNYTGGTIESTVGKIEIFSPIDELNTSNPSIEIIGIINEPKANAVFINSKRAQFTSLQGNFKATVGLKGGTNSILIEAKRGDELLAMKELIIVKVQKVVPKKKEVVKKKTIVKKKGKK